MPQRPPRPRCFRNGTFFLMARPPLLTRSSRGGESARTATFVQSRCFTTVKEQTKEHSGILCESMRTLVKTHRCVENDVKFAETGEHDEVTCSRRYRCGGPCCRHRGRIGADTSHDGRGSRRGGQECGWSRVVGQDRKST